LEFPKTIESIVQWAKTAIFISYNKFFDDNYFSFIFSWHAVQRILPLAMTSSTSEVRQE